MRASFGKWAFMRCFWLGSSLHHGDVQLGNLVRLNFTIATFRFITSWIYFYRIVRLFIFNSGLKYKKSSVD